jgi:DNA-binding transcriptional regulator YiaG
MPRGLRTSTQCIAKLLVTGVLTGSKKNLGALYCAGSMTCAKLRCMATRRLSLPFDGRRAREQRERKGLTLADLEARCERAGRKITVSTLSRWETGVFGPTAARLMVLAAALDVDVDDLLTPNEDPTAECA